MFGRAHRAHHLITNPIFSKLNPFCTTNSTTGEITVAPVASKAKG